jgi:hypothetical protein
MGLSRSAIHLPYPLFCCMQIGYACSLETNFAAASNSAWWAQQMETDTFGMCDSAESCQEASRTSDFLEAVFRIEGADMWALSVEERVAALRDQAVASNDFIDACDMQAMAIQEAAMASPPPPAIQEAASASPPLPATLSPLPMQTPSLAQTPVLAPPSAAASLSAAVALIAPIVLAGVFCV